MNRDATPNLPATGAKTRRLGPRATIAALVVVVVAFVAIFVWGTAQRDFARGDAQRALSRLGLGGSVGPSQKTGRTVTTYRARKPTIDDADLEEIAGHLAVLTRRYEFFTNDGDTIESIDLRSTAVTKQGVEKLQQRFPETEILH
jgi:hypothetical protein